MKQMEKSNINMPFAENQDENNIVKQEHSYGTIWEASECNMLQKTKKGSMLIAPFHDHRYTENVLILNPQTLKMLQRTPANGIWRLWDNYYAAFQKDMSYVDNITLYTISGKGLKKMKNLDLDMEYSFTTIERIIGSKKLKTIYLMEDYWVGIVPLYSSKRNDWASEEEIINAFVHDELQRMLICTLNKVIVYKLDDEGNISEEELYSIPLENEFVTSDLEGDLLTVVTITEKEEEEISCVFVSKFQVLENEWKCIQEEKYLVTLPFTEYDFQLLDGNKVLVCMSDHEPLMMLSVETGEMFYKKNVIGKFLQLDTKEGIVYLSSYTGLKKFSIHI